MLSLMMLHKTVWLLLLSNIGHVCSSHDLPEVETPVGRIRGVWNSSYKGRKYAVYEGIPYAKPPVGELRFEEPQPIEPWTKVLNATQLHSCLQLPLFNASGKIEGDEDCLHLNVYVPTEDTNSPKNYDVVFIIHGGGYVVGNAHRLVNSKFYMDRDIIVVTINYRIGILGFLSTEDGAIPGNNGMKDQVLALRWVQDNIASFGGNPDSVTITGVSAGGTSVHLHYLSPMSKGLFARGLSQSGTALVPWVIHKNPLENAKKLAMLVDCPDTPTDVLKQCLKEKPALEIVEKMIHFYGHDEMPFSPFAPVVEKNSPNPFLAKNPYVLLKEGNVLDLPWITSTTAHDGLFPAGFYASQLEEIDNSWTDVAHYFLDYNYTLPIAKRQEVARRIKEFYLGPGEHFNERQHQFIQMFTDRMFAIGAEKAAKLQARVNASPVYYYFFNYEDGGNKVAPFLSRGKVFEGELVSHGDDSIYFYGFSSLKSFTEKDEKLYQACQDMLYSYAKTGTPSFDGTDYWQPTNYSELIYLNITGPENMQLQTTKHFAPSEFWSSLGLMEDENLINKDE